MKTSIKQDHYKHWIAKTDIELPNDKLLTITTRKSNNGGLLSCASVASYEKGFLTHVMYQDFSIRSEHSNPKRVTAKVVEHQHNTLDFDSVKLQALAFYKLI
jgi:hypothetical protein